MSNFGILESRSQREALSSQPRGEMESLSMLCGNMYISSLAVSHNHKTLPVDINLLPCFQCQSKNSTLAFHFMFHRLEIFSNLMPCDLKT